MLPWLIGGVVAAVVAAVAASGDSKDNKSDESQSDLAEDKLRKEKHDSVQHARLNEKAIKLNQLCIKYNTGSQRYSTYSVPNSEDVAIKWIKKNSVKLSDSLDEVFKLEDELRTVKKIYNKLIKLNNDN